jgi:hypothetical protein
MKLKKANVDGTFSEVTFNHDATEAVVRNVQDVAPILDHNKARQNESHNTKAAGKLAASIPHVIWTEWMREFRKTHGKEYGQSPNEVRQAFIKLKLNDRDNAFLRVWQGKL